MWRRWDSNPRPLDCQLRRLIGLKTQTRADVVLKSFIKMVVNDPDALEIIQYEQRS